MGNILDSSTQYSKFNEANDFEVDNFIEMQDYGVDDISDIEEYQSLKSKKTVLTSAEQTRLSELMAKLKDKMLSVEKLNTILQSVAYMQKYFRDNTVALVQSCKTSLLEYIETAKTQFNEILQTYIGRLTVRDGYDVSATYYQGNIVTYTIDGSTEIYFCINDNSGSGIKGISPTATAYWAKISLKGEKGEPGANLVWEKEWSSTKTYSDSALVWFNDGLYISKADNNLGNVPTQETNDYWQFWQYDVPKGSITEEKLNSSLITEIDTKIENASIMEDIETGDRYTWGISNGLVYVTKINQ